jgi:hypothetical protein
LALLGIITLIIIISKLYKKKLRIPKIHFKEEKHRKYHAFKYPKTARGRELKYLREEILKQKKKKPLHRTRI